MSTKLIDFDKVSNWKSVKCLEFFNWNWHRNVVEYFIICDETENIYVIIFHFLVHIWRSFYLEFFWSGSLVLQEKVVGEWYHRKRWLINFCFQFRNNWPCICAPVLSWAEMLRQGQGWRGLGQCSRVWCCWEVFSRSGRAVDWVQRGPDWWWPGNEKTGSSPWSTWSPQLL